MRNKKGQFVKGFGFWSGKKRPGIGNNLKEHVKKNGPWNKGMKGRQPWHNTSGLNSTGHVPHNKGRSPSPETIEKIKKARAKQGPLPRGKNHHNWRGGVTRLRTKLYNTYIYKKWRLDIFIRDKFTCQICGCTERRKLQADHIKAYSLIIHENKIKTVIQAKKCSELWDLSNGRTLCIPCHQKTDNYGSKAIIRKT